MHTLETLKSRHSIRSFNDKPVAREIIEKIIDAGRHAPTARNVQPWEFVAITEKPVLKKIGSLAENGSFIGECVCCIAVFCRDTKYYLEDGCAATENILIAATDLGLASCWVAGDKKPYCGDIKELLNAPIEFNLVSLVPLGYSDLKGPLSGKKPLKEILHWEKF